MCPSEEVHLRLAIEGKDMFTYYSVRIIYSYISEYYFQNHCMLTGNYILVIFHRIFVISNFRGTCSSIEMLEGYMVRECLITPVLNVNHVPSPRGALVGLFLQTKLQANPNWNTKHYKSVDLCQFLECQATTHKRKAPLLKTFWLLFSLNFDDSDRL